MSFRRTAISLIIIAFVTAGVAAVYLWYNFTARSNIVLLVPENCRWFYHFQTKKIRSATGSQKPVYLDSVAALLSKAPVFKNVKDPGEVGVTLFSDILLFGTDDGEFCALSVNSEPRLTRFFNELAPRGTFGGLVSTPWCQFVKVSGRNLYVAYKHKALVIFRPKDTTDNLRVIEKGLAGIFNEKGRKPITAVPAVQALYNSDCRVVFYSPAAVPVRSHGYVYAKNGGLELKSQPDSPALSNKEALSLFSFAAAREGFAFHPAETVTASVQHADENLKFLYYWLLNI